MFSVDFRVCELCPQESGAEVVTSGYVETQGAELRRQRSSALRAVGGEKGEAPGTARQTLWGARASCLPRAAGCSALELRSAASRRRRRQGLSALGEGVLEDSVLPWHDFMSRTCTVVLINVPFHVMSYVKLVA